MTHEERLALINRPFFIRYMGVSYPWSGTIVGDRFPVGRSGEDLLSDAEIEQCRYDYLVVNGRRILGGSTFRLEQGAQ